MKSREREHYRYFAIFGLACIIMLMLTVTKTYAAGRYDLSNSNIYKFKLKKDEYKYTGKAIKPKVVGLNKASRKVLKSTKNYSIKYNDNIYANWSAEVIIKGKGKYSGEYVLEFRIYANDFNMLKCIKKTKNSIIVKFNHPGEDVVVYAEPAHFTSFSTMPKTVSVKVSCMGRSLLEVNNRWKKWNTIRLVTLKGLEPNTEYRVRVASSESGARRLITVKTRK